MFENIPDELKNYKQWVMWRLEKIDDDPETKPTKVPYSIRGYNVSVLDYHEFGTFSDVVACYQSGAYSGIGFVFTENDPYAFIDLDDCGQDGELIAYHMELYSVFSSYSEISPSGNGLHIIVKGSIPEGRRNSAKKIEIYSSQRYATFTGNIYGAERQIHDRSALLNLVFEKLTEQRKRSDEYKHLHIEQTQEDAEIIDIASRAVNGDKFYNLFAGNWHEYYQSQSEADQSLINMIAFYTQNRDQIKRIFRSSALGQRAKAQREKYVDDNITLAFDRQIPPIDISGLKERFLEIQKSAVYSDTIENRNTQQAGNVYKLPPGILGDLAQFIYDAAPRQVKEVALAGAIAYLAGITGRCYNISNTGLNQYVFFLANTGIGKDAISNGFDKMNAAIRWHCPQIDDYMGPSEIASPQGLVRALDKRPCFVSIWGEAGLALQEMTSARPSPARHGLKRLFLDLYMRSGAGRRTNGTVYSEQEKNIPILKSPSFSFIGESNPDSFYSALNEKMITEGLLPRFTTIYYNGLRPHTNDQARYVFPSAQLQASITSLVGYCCQLNMQEKVIDIQLDNDATAILKQFDIFCDDKVNSSTTEVYRHLWTRAHLKSLKLAGLLSVGINPYNPIVCKNAALWAINLILFDINTMLEKFDSALVGENNHEALQYTIVKNTITHYLKTPWEQIAKSQQTRTTQSAHSLGVITLSFISVRVLQMADFRNDKIGATAALKRTLALMLENGDIKELTFKEKENYGLANARCFVPFNAAIFI